MLGIKVLFLISAILISYNSAYTIKSNNKRSVGANECKVDLYNTVIQELSETGLSEADIPPFDPFEIKKLEVVLMGMFKIVVSDGTVKGFKTCRSENFRTDPEKLIATVEMSCETLSIEGKYKMETTPTLDAIIGDIKVYGEGQGSAKLEDLKIKLQMPFEIKQSDDSELHLGIISDRLTYTVESVGNLVINGDNLYVGSQEISSVIVNIFNENWKFFIKTFGNSILDVAMKVAVEYVNKFFAKISLKDLVSGDLSSYVTH